MSLTTFGCWSALSCLIWLCVSFLPAECINGSMYIIFSNKKDIRRFKYGTSKYSNIRGGLEESQALAYDYEEKVLFYTNLKELGNTVIERLSLDESNDARNFRQNFIVLNSIPDVNGYVGLTVDWITKNLYFCDELANRIEVVNFDGSNRRALVSKKLDQPRDIAVLPQLGYMFITDWGDQRKIERYNMDGTNATILVDKNIRMPISIAVDSKTHLVYWGDVQLHTIDYITVNGEQRKTIKLKDNQLPQYLSVFDNVIYWSNTVTSLFMLRKDAPLSTVVEVRELGGSPITPYGLVLFHQEEQPPTEVTSPCSVRNGGCSHFCLLKSVGYTCACPTGFPLESDGKTCAVERKKFLLIARYIDIRIMSLEADQNVDVILPIKGIRRAVGLDYDVLQKKVYWTDQENKTISCSYLNGTGIEHIVTVNLIEPGDIAIDWMSRQIYWTDLKMKRIEVSRLDGFSRKVIISKNVGEPRGIAVDPRGKLYWSDWDENISRIEFSDLDGSDRKILLERKVDRIMWPNSITLDLQNRVMYWVDAKYKSVSAYDLVSGVNKVIYSNEQSHPFAITTLGEDIFWTDWYRKVMKGKKKNDRVAKPILTGHTLTDVRGIKAVSVDLTYDVDAPCYYKTNNCSHLCFRKFQEVQPVCACPEEMELGKDGRTCQVPSGFLLFSEGHNIYMTSVDTFVKVEKLNFLPLFDKIYFLDVHYAKQRVFWVGEIAGGKGAISINQAFLNGTDYSQIVTEGISTINGFSIDWLAGNIYWVLSQPGRIEVSRLDGQFRKVLIYGEDIISPRIVAVNPHLQKIYWFHEQRSMIAQYTLWEAHLDGSNRARLVENQTPRDSLIIDYKTNIIYWINESGDRVESIQSYDPQTQTHATALSNINAGKLSSLVVFNNDFLFSDKHAASRSLTIKKMALNSTTPDKKDVISFTPKNMSDNEVIWVQDMKIFHPTVQSGSNNCTKNNGGCEHLCFALSQTKYTCSCATHFNLNQNGKFCDAVQHFMFLSTGKSIRRIVFNNSVPDGVLPVSVPEPPKSIDFDVNKKLVYFLLTNKFVRSSEDGSVYETKDILNDDGTVGLVHDFSIDPFGDAMYWTDEKHNTINYLNLRTFTNGTLVAEQKFRPRKIVVYPENAKMYWTSIRLMDNGVNIMESSLAGSETLTLHELEDRSRVLGLTIDYSEKRLYWLDSEFKSISSITMDGKDMKLYNVDSRFMEEPVAFGVFMNYIYWVDTAIQFIVRLHKHKQMSPEEFYGKYDNMHAMVMVNYTRVQEYHPCSVNNGGCSYICHIDHEVTTGVGKPKVKALCGCPLYYQPSADKIKCLPAAKCLSDEIFCKTDSRCIKKALQCNYQCDCPHGCEDENCEYPRECLNSQTLVPCGIGCIDKRRKCDGIRDCPSGEDENDCENPCKPYEFFCDGNCVINRSLCDGIIDCKDERDEANCSTHVTMTPIERPPAPQKSSVVAGIISGVIICIILLMFSILLWLKFRNSKKNAAQRHLNGSFLQLSHLNQKTESITSEDQAKSSVSTYISASSHVTEPSYYDRNYITGASSTITSEYTRILYNPPPSPMTALSIITETNDPFGYTMTCEHCRGVIEETPLNEMGVGDAPPPTLASTTLIDEVDLYIPIQQPKHSWSQKPICHSCEASVQMGNGRSRQSSLSRRSVNRHQNPKSYRNNEIHHMNELEPLQKQQNQRRYLYENNLDSIYDDDCDSIYMAHKQQRHHFFDPPPTPCTYLSDDERPSSPARTEHSLAFSVIRGNDDRPFGVHYAPPPSPTSQL